MNVVFQNLIQMCLGFAKDELGLAAQLELLPRVKHSVASVARLLEVTSDIVLQALQASVFLFSLWNWGKYGKV